MKILVLEDDAVLAAELRKFLEANHYQCKNVYDGELFLKEVQKDTYDYYLLDINVPKIDGIEVCKRVRATDRDTPIIIISAYGDISDKREAFQSLADDYLVKPFQFEELLMRMDALKRRKSAPDISGSDIIRIADLVMDRNGQKVYRGGKEISLTVKEYMLLLLFAESPGRIFSKQQISEKVWDINFSTNTNTIEVYINFLRKKIDKDFDVKLIHTRSGFGYYLKAE
ncbi:response regulator transcription factor [Weeksellaceae bacterium A-14]